MIKGCQKRVVWLHSTESEWFEEAYFILSEKKDKKKVSEEDMVSEANRIIAESRGLPSGGGLFLGSEITNAIKKSEMYAYLRFKWFSIGAVLASSVGIVIGYFLL